MDVWFQAAALALMAVFYICYFGKMIAQKRQGIQTDQLGKGKSGRIRGIEISLKTVTCIVPLVELIHIFGDISRFSTPVRVVGMIVALAGDGFFLAAVVTMADSWRAGVSTTEKTKLVTHGVFQISRNPAFLGFDLLYLGIVMMFFSWPLYMLTVLAYILFHIQIVHVEEVYLLSAFGEAYSQYQKRVCRYLGRKPF